MKYGVSPNILLLTAGVVWMIAGVNIFRIGLTCWADDERFWMLKLAEACLVFLFFFSMIFHRLYKKHTRRIAQKRGRRCPFSFFDAKSWIIMAVMIGFGVSARRLHLLPESFIAVFYTGLSVALMATGLRFIYYRLRYPVEES